MIKLAAIVAIIFVVLGIIIYSIFTSTSPESETQKKTITEVPPALEYSALIASQSQRKSPTPSIYEFLYAPKQTSHSGYIRLSNVARRVLIQVYSELPDSNYGYIHSGSCNQTGKALYPLVTLKEGKSQTVWNTSIEAIRENLPMSIKVFKEDTPSNTYISCADLK